jgi:cytochrome c oxidase subunit 2
MGIFWSLLFLAVPVLGVATFAVAPSFDIWLPRDVSEHGRTIDGLFMFILVLTGVVFVATEGLLFWFLWKYDAAKAKGPATYIHGSHSLEVIWTILPAATLLFLAIY